MRKILILLSMMTVFISHARQEDSAWQCPEGFEGKTLRILNFSSYVAEDTIPNFEEACDVEVEYNISDSSEATLTLLRQGSVPYDIVMVSGDTVSRMVNENLLHPLNKDNIPNFANLSADFLNPEYDPESAYVVPYAWGLMGVGYNTEMVGEEITSWEQVFEYSGPVAWLDDTRSMFGVALLMLGYDPSTTDEAQIQEAKDYLLEHSDNVVTVSPDDGQVLLEQYNVDIALEYNGDILQLMNDCECDEFAFSIPEEGALLYMDNLAIPAVSENPELAEAFINYVLDPHVNASISNYIAYGSANQASIDQGLIEEELLNSPFVYPPSEVMERLYITNDVEEAGDLYNEYWEQVVTEISTR